MRRMRQIVWGVVVTALGLGAAAPAAAQGGPPAGAPPELWWEQTSLAGKGPEDVWKRHVEGQIAYMWADGNTDGHTFDASAALVLRRQRWTNRFDVSNSHHDVVYGLGGGSVQTVAHTIADRQQYDILPHILVEAGVEYYKNSLMFIDNRTQFYGGGGVAIVDTARQKLSVTGGVGYAFFDFDGEAMAQIDPVAVAALPTDTPTTVGVTGMQAWHVTLPNRIQIMEDASFTDYANGDLGHQWMVGLSVTLPVSKYFSVVPSFRAREEANVYIEALHVRERDNTFNVGLRASF